MKLIRHTYMVGPRRINKMLFLFDFENCCHYIFQKTKVCLNSERVKNLKLLLMVNCKLGKVELYSSWGSIVSNLFFYWGEVLFKSGVAFKRIRYVYLKIK